MERRDEEEHTLRKREVEAVERQHIQLEPLRDSDDVDAYLAHFERVAKLCQWSKSSWSTRLLALLREKAREAVLRLSPDELTDYSKVKAALLRHFRLDAEAYRRKFRSMKKEVSETFGQLLDRMRTCLSLWCTTAGKNEDSAEDLKDLILQEQMYQVMTPELLTEVRRARPKTADEVAGEATILAEAKRMGREARQERGIREKVGNAPAVVSEVRQNPVRESREVKSQASSGRSQAQAAETRPPAVICYNCKKPGHRARFCPEASAIHEVKTLVEREDTGLTVPTLCVSCARKPFTPRCMVSVNGLTVDAVRDTGAGYTVVAEKLVSLDAYTGEQVPVILAEARCRSKLPVAVVRLESPFIHGELEVLVMKKPAEDVLIGNFARRKGSTQFERVPVYAVPTLVAVIETRAQAKKKRQPESVLTVEEQVVGVKREDLISMQQEDPTLEKVRLACDSKKEIRTRNGKVRFKRKNGVLIREFTDVRGTSNLICVPKPLRPSVLGIAHDIPMAGHMGVKRTKDRVFAEFYWPGMCSDVARYCQSCAKCQRTVDKGRVYPVPLVKMPLEEEPFAKVGMDIIGPITPISANGYRYVLVMVDFATRYPEATPLRNVTAETVAEAAYNMWTRTGIPGSVLTDRGTQFTSQVMAEVFALLAIKGMKTTPYHAQCNGLVERFNGTLKKMMRRLTQERPEEWDRWIPSLLFAYREVPQESTGFSPFELLYGRKVRGPMRVLRDAWLHPERTEVQTAAQYVVDLRNKIADSCSIAQENIARAATRYKRHFDIKAKPRSFALGSRVLVLRPTKHNKLELAWRGPYSVTARVGEVDYKVKVGAREKVFHANLLKQFMERDQDLVPDNKVRAVVVQEEEVETVPLTSKEIPVIPLEATEGPGDVVIRAEDEGFAEALRGLTQKFASMLTDLPSCTTLETCKVKLTTDTPVRSKPYPLPYAQRQTVREEIQNMVQMGAIEQSVSPYSSPIVLVRKKDGKIRFCVDYRKLNKIVEFDAEPIPEVEYLFAKLGEKRVFSKIDLAKGYWQIPMDEADRPKTAFSTPEGHFQWKVMPFGLCTSGAVFTRMMRKLLQPLQSDDVDNFIDDILIATVTEEEHLRVLESVFQRLQECSLTARPSKCQLGCREIAYLGHRIGEGKIRPEEDKMNKIRTASRPETKKQVRSFLGLVGYYRRFIPNFSDLALPLTNLTKARESRKVTWTTECETAFQTLKECFCNPPICNLPVPGKKFVLRTDASGTGIGAMLFQEYEDGLRPIACASKKLLPAEKNYPTIEKECLALMWGVIKFECYLYDTEFVVQTDHSPLQYLDKIKSTSGRVTRWALQLQPFRFTVQVIPGCENREADYLSRM